MEYSLGELKFHNLAILTVAGEVANEGSFSSRFQQSVNTGFFQLPRLLLL